MKNQLKLQSDIELVIQDSIPEQIHMDTPTQTFKITNPYSNYPVITDGKTNRRERRAAERKAKKLRK